MAMHDRLDAGSVLPPPPFREALALVVVLATALLLREAASVLVPLLFGGFLALAAGPIVDALERRSVARPVAVSLTILVILAAILGTAALVIVSVTQLVALMPTYEERFTAFIVGIQDELSRFGIAADADALLSLVPPDQLAAIVRAIAASVSSAGLAVLVLVLTMAYALAGAASLRARAEAVFGRDHALLVGVDRFRGDLRRYLVVRALLGLFAAALVLLLLLILRVPLAPLWAFLVFAASFVPNVGVIVALVPPTFLALLDGGPATAAAVVIGYLAINFAQDNLLQPVVLGAELNLSPLAVFVAVVVWAWILGAAGALLAVPLTVGLVAILEAYPASRPIAALLRARNGTDSVGTTTST
jgi:AI-2 transport protein TqsA